MGGRGGPALDTYCYQCGMYDCASGIGVFHRYGVCHGMLSRCKWPPVSSLIHHPSSSRFMCIPLLRGTVHVGDHFWIPNQDLWGAGSGPRHLLLVYQLRHLPLSPTLFRCCWLLICISILRPLRPLLYGSGCANGHVWQVLAEESCPEVEDVAGREGRLKLGA